VRAGAEKYRRRRRRWYGASGLLAEGDGVVHVALEGLLDAEMMADRHLGRGGEEW